MTCPFCSSGEVERIAQWGGQLITAQWRCGACNSYFEAVRDGSTPGGDGPPDPPAFEGAPAELPL